MIKHLSPTFIQTIQHTFGEAGQQWLNGLNQQLTQLALQLEFRINDLMPHLTFNI